MRRRRVVVPGISVVERLAAAVLHDAGREVWSTVTGRLDDVRTRRLDVLLEERAHERQSRFSRLREPAGAAAMNAILDRLDRVRGVALDRAITAGIPAPRLRQLVREGARLTAQGLRQTMPPRRRAILAATVLDPETDLTDVALDALDASLGRALAVVRRKREAEILDGAGACDAAVRKLAALGDALLEARAVGGKLEDAVQRAAGWDQLGGTVARAKGLFRGNPNDRAALLMTEQASVRRLGPRLLASFRFHGAPACERCSRPSTCAGCEGARPVDVRRRADSVRDRELATAHAPRRRQPRPARLRALRARRAQRSAPRRRRLGRGLAGLPSDRRPC
jgi:hypothetical protein